MADVPHRVVHFHCDHFEPYARMESGCVGPAHAEILLDQLPACLPLKLTAFFSSQTILYDPAGDRFYAGSHAAEDRQILGMLAAHRADVQIHVHHEPWTENGSALKRLLPQLLAERESYAGVPADSPWYFVHGCWGLNASDPTVCKIEDELCILYSAGCTADFTFPAGRRHCNPPWSEPRACLPVAGAAAYQTLAVDPQPVNIARYSGPPRLLIWSSGVDAAAASLDCIAMGLCSPERAAEEWLTLSPIIDGVQYIKTHGHCLSMWPSPLLSASVARAFELLREQAGAPVEWMTATQVLEELTWL